MKRFSRREDFDERTLPELDSEAIDFRVASESFAPVRRLARKDLDRLRLVASYQGRKVPTVGGIVLLRRHADGYPVVLAHSVLSNANGIAVMSGMQAVVIGGAQPLQRELIELAAKHPSCLPPPL